MNKSPQRLECGCGNVSWLLSDGTHYSGDPWAEGGPLHGTNVLPSECCPIESSPLHASVPALGLKCSDCTIDGEACPICYTAWWRQRHPHTQFYPSLENEPSAWLFVCKGDGRREAFASVDPNDTTHWPLDQWRSVTKVPLYSREEPISPVEIQERIQELRREMERLTGLILGDPLEGIGCKVEYKIPWEQP